MAREAEVTSPRRRQRRSEHSFICLPFVHGKGSPGYTFPALNPVLQPRPRPRPLPRRITRRPNLPSSPSEPEKSDDVQNTTTPQSNEIEDADFFAEIESPELPHLMELLSNDGSQSMDDVKLPRLKSPERWQDRIRAQCNGQDYCLEARTTDDAALAFIAMLTEMTKGVIQPKEYKPTVPTTCTIEDRCALVSPMRPFYM